MLNTMIEFNFKGFILEFILRIIFIFQFYRLMFLSPYIVIFSRLVLRVKVKY